MAEQVAGFVAECYWPDVHEEEVRTARSTDCRVALRRRSLPRIGADPARTRSSSATSKAPPMRSAGSRHGRTCRTSACSSANVSLARGRKEAAMKGKPDQARCSWLWSIAGARRVAGGIAYATIPDSGGVIHGCYEKAWARCASLIRASPRCARSSRPRSTGANGPQRHPRAAGTRGHQKASKRPGPRLVRPTFGRSTVTTPRIKGGLGAAPNEENPGDDADASRGGATSSSPRPRLYNENPTHNGVHL